LEHSSLVSSTALSVLSAIYRYSATLSSLTLGFAKSIKGVSDLKIDIKKTLARLGDGDLHHDK